MTTTPYQETFHSTLEAIIAALPSKEKDSLLTDFTKQFYRSLSLSDVQEIEPELAQNIASLVFDEYKTRDVHYPKITITTPEFLQSHFGRSRLVVTVANRNMPFLVDSIAIALSQLGFTIYRTIHPQLWVNRDANGTLLKSHNAPYDGGNPESCMYMELSPMPEGMTTENITAHLFNTLNFVQHAVEDWRVMLAKLREVGTHIALTSNALPASEIEEASAFFDWILKDNFTFLGFVEYDFYDAQGNECLTPIQGSELGIFKIDQSDLIHRGLASLPPEVRHFVLQPEPVGITKSNRRSIVHRDVLMDYIGVKRYNSTGKVIGESRFLGLFTSPVYYQKTTDIPYIRSKVARVLDEAGFDRSGHSGKALKAVLEFFPRDELFQIAFEDLLDTALGIVSLEERPDIRVFFRRDRFERFVSCFVYMPRDRFNTYVREEIGHVLEQHVNGKISTFYSQLTDSPLARVNYIIQTTPAHIPPLDIQKLNAELRFIINYWVDSLRETMQDTLGEQRGELLFRQFGKAFPKNYINTTSIEHAIEDTLRLKHVAESSTPSFHLFMSHESQQWHLKMYAHAKDIALSDILPMIENLGFKVRDVIPYNITPEIDQTDQKLLIRDFSLLPNTTDHIDFTLIKPLVEDALCAIWAGETANDMLSALTILAGLNTRQVMLIRAYQRYAKQAGLGYSDSYVATALCKHASITATLVELFEARFNPSYEMDRTTDSASLYKSITTALSDVDNIIEDKILRFFADTIQATLRTNYYQTTNAGTHKPYLSFKLESRLIPNLPLPHPWREIFVYSMTTEGIHLRGGKVARGGLRWSDRHEDFRTEVLGLMKAQIVKNTVIVPTGSKGGFVVKAAHDALDREARLAAGIASYQQFLSGLLDLTDNRMGTEIITPHHTICYDEQDPYLVVAADKGTATFSDIANAVSQEYNFWLGDAFASGGSVGYDHKKMGITARGGWISVEQHFLEMGKDITTTDFTVSGIGDMSGDVFGNGMLLSKHIKLVAAFNHLHIFIDPTPDAAKSFQERGRLFDLGRGSWDSYDAKLISKGGGVFLRSAKSITLTPEMQAMLGTTVTAATPNELIRLILKMNVDLLWNGGIGTYVKASSESHEEVGDPSNNGLRINGDELRCAVVGEGGNLGMTQRGRIEYARLGGRLNTDAIDNSAGVDCSDHEVNIKIALRAIADATNITLEERNTLLEQMTDDVAELVLNDNKQQNKALSIAEKRAPEMIEMHSQFIRALEHDGLLNRTVEFLPTDKQLTDLKASGLGFTRPELSVLLAYSKIMLYGTLAQSKLVDAEIFTPDLLAYFPKALQTRYSDQLLLHPLRREIVATVLTNEIVNRAGITYIRSIHQDTGHDVCNIVRAYVVVRDIFDLSSLWEEIEALKGTLTSDVHISLFTQVTRFLRRMSVWFLSNSEQPPEMERLVKQYRTSIDTFVTHQATIISKSVSELRTASIAALTNAGVPVTLSERIANLDLFLSACDIAMIDHRTKQSLPVIGRLYYELGSRLQLSWLRQFISSFNTVSYWDRLAIRNAINELYDEQRRLTESVLNGLCEDNSCDTTIERWLDANRGDVDRFARLVYDIKSAEKQDLAMIIVTLRQLSTIRGGTALSASIIQQP